MKSLHTHPKGPSLNQAQSLTKKKPWKIIIKFSGLRRQIKDWDSLFIWKQVLHLVTWATVRTNLHKPITELYYIYIYIVYVCVHICIHIQHIYFFIYLCSFYYNTVKPICRPMLKWFFLRFIFLTIIKWPCYICTACNTLDLQYMQAE